MRRGRLSRPVSTGGFTIVRKVGDIWLSNSQTSGVPLIGGEKGSSILTLGTPEANPIFGGVYSLPFSMEFHLNDLSQYIDIQGICDRYKIVDVKVKAMYNATAVQGSSVSASFPSFMPFIKYVTDQDDASVQPTTEMNAKMGLRSKTLAQGKLVSLRCKPRVAPLLYSGTTSAYAVPGKPQWINSGYVDTPHYGIKGYLENFVLQSNAQATSCVTFELTYTVKVKDLQ